jgi:heme/copper-type cytochrome/quinol oxidase subunit 2
MSSSSICMNFYELFHLRNWSFVVLLIALLIPSIMIIIAITTKTNNTANPTKKKFTKAGIILIVITSLYLLFMAFLLYCRVNLQSKASHLKDILSVE